MDKKCINEIQNSNEVLADACKDKVNKLIPCKENENSCNCLSEEGENLVDLVVLVDSSGSMQYTWKSILSASSSLNSYINEKCKANTEVTYLSIDRKHSTSSTDAPAGFTSHEIFLQTHGYSGPFETNSDNTTYAGEEGSKAIVDISNHFPWRKNACRAILYISDEWLDSVNHGASGSLASIPSAVNAANSNNVTIFTHLVDSGYGSQNIPSNHPEIDEHYTMLAESTGGSAHIGDEPSEELYLNLISDVVCNCKKCINVDMPEIKPCINISWGDSECDCFETDDFEVLCITVCNCYSNITFNNFTIARIEITDENGNEVATLPDGMPSIQAIPAGTICFGDIPPCNKCISREFAIRTKGAKDGKYLVNLHGVCFDVSFNSTQDSCFIFTLCKD